MASPSGGSALSWVSQLVKQAFLMDWPVSACEYWSAGAAVEACNECVLDRACVFILAGITLNPSSRRSDVATRKKLFGLLLKVQCPGFEQGRIWGFSPHPYAWSAQCGGFSQKVHRTSSLGGPSFWRSRIGGDSRAGSGTAASAHCNFHQDCN
jgi:hypothetical protein